VLLGASLSMKQAADNLKIFERKSI